MRGKYMYSIHDQQLIILYSRRFDRWENLKLLFAVIASVLTEFSFSIEFESGYNYDYPRPCIY